MALVSNFSSAKNPLSPKNVKSPELYYPTFEQKTSEVYLYNINIILWKLLAQNLFPNCL